MWSLDRRVAASAFVVGALALAIPIAVSDAPVPEVAGDPIALARELAALANRGAGATWMVTYEFTRITATRGRLRDTIVVAHVAATKQHASLEVDQGLGSLVVTAGHRTYSCTVPLDEPQCLERATTDRTSRPGAVYGGAVVSGRYDIASAPTQQIAGLEARCFSLRLRAGRPVPGVGFAALQCSSTDGVPLRSVVQGPRATDSRVALTVRRVVGRAELMPVLSQYGLERLAPAR